MENETQEKKADAKTKMIVILLVVIFISISVGMFIERNCFEEKCITDTLSIYDEVQELKSKTQEFEFKIANPKFNNYSLILFWQCTEKCKYLDEIWRYEIPGLLRHNSGDVERDWFIWININADTLLVDYSSPYKSAESKYYLVKTL